MHFSDGWCCEGSCPAPDALQSTRGAAGAGLHSPAVAEWLPWAAPSQQRCSILTPACMRAEAGKVGKLMSSSVWWILLQDMGVKHTPEV